MRYFDRSDRPSADELDAMPTLCQGQSADLKWENGDDLRFWLHRTGVEDGEPFARTVTVEVYDHDGRFWADHAVYDGEAA